MKNPQLYPEQSKDNKKINLVPENQPEKSERQPVTSRYERIKSNSYSCENRLSQKKRDMNWRGSIWKLSWGSFRW